MFQPSVLSPDPDPNFSRELKRIDPNLRVVWGYQQYFVNQWAIERKIPPERYFQGYASLFDQDLPRFIDQPIFDTDQPEYDDEGNETGYKIVGYRKYDCAPEFEHLMFAPALNQQVLTELRRIYAWNQNHWLTRAKYEQDQREQREKAQAAARVDAGMDALKDAYRALGKTLQGGQPTQVMEGTEL